MEINIRPINQSDIHTISEAFRQQGWNKSPEKYAYYLHLQTEGKRDILIAESGGEFAGYLTICWKSYYLPFLKRNIPEVVDFNVLKKFQRQGIGTALMDEAERRISKVSTVAGIGFGVTKDYGAAQILYIRRGYIPDGNGLIKDSRSLPYGESVTIGDDLIFYLTKQLAPALNQ